MFEIPRGPDPFGLFYERAVQVFIPIYRNMRYHTVDDFESQQTRILERLLGSQGQLESLEVVLNAFDVNRPRYKMEEAGKSEQRFETFAPPSHP